MQLNQLIARQRPGFSLDREFYTDADIFERDLDRVFWNHWQFAGHVDRLREPESYFLFNLGRDSVILTRGPEGEIRGFFNTCRHRGSRICLESSGRAKRFVCPYHAWTYDARGRLVSAVGMPEGFNPLEYGLKTCAVRVVEGLIFVRLGAQPSPAGDVGLDDWQRFLAPHGLADAKIAASLTWQVHGNWKLVVENFGECYHCGQAHPEYCAVMAHALPDTYRSPSRVADYGRLKDAWRSHAAALGQSVAETAPTPGAIHSCARQPVKEGFLTQSSDGQPVAPLMGQFTEYDGGYTSGRLWPANYFLASNDHAVIPRFTPIDALHTEVEMIWLVRQDAVEGRDYDRDRLTWLWKVTTDQDKELIHNNQAGVGSRAYSPGPYALTEDGLPRFIAWYLGCLA